MGRKSSRGHNLAILIAVLLVIFIATRHSQQDAPAQNITQNGTTGIPQNASQNDSQNASLNASVASHIRIGNFNIQVFGESKRSKPEVMDVLSKTARRFDVIAIEELRDDTETTLPIYLERINSLPGPRYAATMSPRLGRTSSKENYAFIYNTETIRLVPGSNFTFQDPPEGSANDLFQREPYVARFEAVGYLTFDFALIVIHTEPDTTPRELASLPLALDSALSRYANETDFILLGDMNADCSYLSKSESAALSLRNSSFAWAIPDSADTTVKSTDCAYDRIILAGTTPALYNGTWGIYRFDTEYSLNQSAAEDVSDHYPVWVELKISN